jgi:hypothetical protein
MIIKKETRTPNNTYPKGGVSCSKDSFMGNQTLVFQIKFCGKSPGLRIAAKRYKQAVTTKLNRNNSLKQINNQKLKL